MAHNRTQIPCQALGRVQWEICSLLAAHVTCVETAAEEVDLEEAARLMDEKLLPLQQELQIDLTTVSHQD